VVNATYGLHARANASHSTHNFISSSNIQDKLMQRVVKSTAKVQMELCHSQSVYLRGLEGIVSGKVDVEKEDTTLVWAVRLQR
jgi:hypothetical protein